MEMPLKPNVMDDIASDVSGLDFLDYDFIQSHPL